MDACDLSSQREAGLISLTTDARNMADAITYLIMVARDAGMRRIATKLAYVRSDLLAHVNEEPDKSENDGIRLTPPEPH